MNSDETRLQATKTIWTAIALILIAMFVTTGIWGGGELHAGHIWLGIILAIAGLASMSFIWGDGSKNTQSYSDEAQEKAKREQLDSVLRDLSDEDLLRLKQRLSDGTIDDDVLYDHMTLNDDGELISLDRQK